MSVSVDTLDRARRDPVVFADLLIGQPLWPHQVEVVRSTARYRVLCAGRRSGKTRVFGVLALHGAFSRPGFKVLIVSSGVDSAKNMFADISGMAMGSAHLRGSVADDLTRELTLSNGSTIKCVPSSMKQVRSTEADLLIVDEAGFVDQDIWEAAEPVVGARPGARVLIASSPWRGPGHFFHDLWRQGMDAPDSEVRSWHWPSTVSPLVDQVWLEAVRRRNAPDYFAREYLAEWTDESGAYFSSDELMAAVADYELLSPADARSKHAFEGWFPVAGGIDWGMARDQNAVVLIGVLDDLGLNEDRLPRIFIPWLDARFKWPYEQFLEELCSLAQSFDVKVFASETNGVGDFPTSSLADRLWNKYNVMTPVARVWTDVRRKQSGFGMVKGLLQTGRLVLPRHPELLKELRALEFEQTPSGATKISVPERAGHDDLAMALMQAVLCVHSNGLSQPLLEGRAINPGVGAVSTESGIRVPVKPLPLRDVGWTFVRPKGQEKGESW